MLERELRAHVEDSTRLVLETMCFLIPSIEVGLIDRRRADLTCIQVKFAGALNGSLVMAAGDDAASVFAPAFLGVDEPDHDAVGAVLAEMANMICGAALSRAVPDGLVSLSAPEPLAALPSAEDCTVELELECGCGAIVVQMRIDDGAAAIPGYLETAGFTAVELPVLAAGLTAFFLTAFL